MADTPRIAPTAPGFALWVKFQPRGGRWVRIHTGTRDECLAMQARHAAMFKHSSYCDPLPIGVDPNKRRP